MTNPLKTKTQADINNWVESNDSGGRSPAGLFRYLLLGTALCWSLFQLWIASPLPFYDWPVFGSFGVFNDTESRSIHLAFSIFLSFIAFPAFSNSQTKKVPFLDVIFAVVGAFSAAYLFIFYQSVSSRPGAPLLQDVIVGVIGGILLLEATRRVLGPPLVIIAVVFLIYNFAGPYMPDLIAHKGSTLKEVINHQWITTEGVFGIALGVSTGFVFLFVLFGSLLDKAGAGDYFIKVAFSYLGHYRGGPAKAAVVSSGLTGLISGSSIANVVTTGTFTIPMMKRVGFTAEKAGAIEVASSVNGQIMPPVMGAAAFLMVEYVGLTYVEVIKHAFLPAVISYIALLYIVHLEALKQGMVGISKPKSVTPWFKRLIGMVVGFSGAVIFSGVIYYGVGWIKSAFEGFYLPILLMILSVCYVFLIKLASNNYIPPLESSEDITSIARSKVVKSGLYFIIPVFILIWCLMVERLSPGLSAFWASIVMIFILLTQKSLLAYFNGESWSEKINKGCIDLVDGLIMGARNMIGIGIATATAGIIVGVVSQTGVGSVLADLVEFLSFGNLMVMLILTAFLSLILGMGLPTTANYIVVSSLLAPVIVSLGQQSGLNVPLIAVHLFVFYFGIMADVTPPVGLASFAAAAVSGGDPIKTGITAFFYSLRTALLPFLFIFNTDLLLINVDFIHGVMVFVISTIAILLFTAGSQGYFIVKNRLYESVLLFLIAFSLFRPGFWMDLVYVPYENHTASSMVFESLSSDLDGSMRLHIDGYDEVGKERQFITNLPILKDQSIKNALNDAGVALFDDSSQMVIDNVGFGSVAKEAGLYFDQKITSIELPLYQPPKELIFIPALLLALLLIFVQRRKLVNKSSN